MDPSQATIEQAGLDLCNSMEAEDYLEMRIVKRDTRRATIALFGEGIGDTDLATWLPALLIDATVSNAAGDNAVIERTLALQAQDREALNELTTDSEAAAWASSVWAETNVSALEVEDYVRLTLVTVLATNHKRFGIHRGV